MSLILTIQSIDGQACTEQSSAVIGEDGGSIGRSDTCSLVLADENKQISRCHAKISYINSQYTLADCSLAGTYINNASDPINNAVVELFDGMVVRVGVYDILVAISEPQGAVESQNEEADVFGSLLEQSDESLAAAPFLAADPFADVSMVSQTESNSLLDSVGTNFETPFSNHHQYEVSNDLLKGPESELAQFDSGLMAENISSLNDSYIPPLTEQKTTQLGEMPEDFNFEDLFDTQSDAPSVALDNPRQKIEPIQAEIVSPKELLDSIEPISEPHYREEQSLTIPKPQPQSNLDEKNSNSHLLQRFLKGAEIDDSSIDVADLDNKMTAIGAMFRQFVDSTVAVLRSRAEFKSLFRVTVTTIRRADNNPLKFAVTTDEAIKHLINDGQGGFKPAIESIDEGFNDLLNHQLAMQAGIQASLSEILQQFNPANIEKQYREGLVLQKKSKCWEKYNKLYAELSESAVDDFFGDAFSEAYEKQMKQLKP